MGVGEARIKGSNLAAQREQLNNEIDALNKRIGPLEERINSASKGILTCCLGAKPKDIAQLAELNIKLAEAKEALDDVIDKIRLKGNTVLKLTNVENYSEGFSKACKKGDLVEMERMIKGGISLDSCDKEGNTYLHIACQTKNVGAIEMLLKANPKLEDVENTKGLKPKEIYDYDSASLLRACAMGADKELIVELREKGLETVCRNLYKSDTIYTNE